MALRGIRPSITACSISEAPFSEPREWTECGDCSGADYLRLTLRERDDEAPAPCSKCGQRPPCRAGSATEDRHCPRPATADHGALLVCGQHYRAFELQCDEDEWTQARRHMRHLCALAKSVGNFALQEALGVAWAEVEMRIAAIEPEQEILWTW